MAKIQVTRVSKPTEPLLRQEGKWEARGTDDERLSQPAAHNQSRTPWSISILLHTTGSMGTSNYSRGIRVTSGGGPAGT